MYAVIIGSASTLLSNLDIVQSERKRKLDEIRAYLRHRKVGRSYVVRSLSSMNICFLAT